LNSGYEPTDTYPGPGSYPPPSPRNEWTEAVNWECRELGTKTIAIENLDSTYSLEYDIELYTEDILADESAGVIDWVGVKNFYFANPYTTIIVKVRSSHFGSEPNYRCAYTSNALAVIESIDVGLVTVAKREQLHVNVDFSTIGDHTIIEPVIGKQIRICHLLLMSGTASPIEVAIKSGEDTIKTIVSDIIALDFSEHCNLGAGKALVLTTTTTDRVVGGVDYYLEIP